jgi:glucosamine--fructose-6-phosphate aminotransferase (isomerizing)
VDTHPLLQSARELPQGLSAALPQIAAEAARVLAEVRLEDIRQVVITGSGDSYIAALGATAAWRTASALPVAAVPAMDAARYFLSQATGQHTLLICVSHSGEAARVIEAAQRGRAGGARTLALTAHPGSRLGSACAHVLRLPVQDSASAPGTLSYCASLLALYCLILEQAGSAGLSTAITGMRGALSEMPALMASALSASESVAVAWAEAWHSFRCVDILGSGPGTGAAAFTAAKLVEAVGLHAGAQDLEEFFHLNYFVAEPISVGTVVYAPTHAASASRATELGGALLELGRPVLWISDGPPLHESWYTITLPQVSELLLPLLATIPAAILAAALGERLGADSYRGQRGPWRSSRNAALVRGSSIEPQQKGK